MRPTPLTRFSYWMAPCLQSLIFITESLLHSFRTQSAVLFALLPIWELHRSLLRIFVNNYLPNHLRGVESHRQSVYPRGSFLGSLREVWSWSLAKSSWGETLPYPHSLLYYRDARNSHWIAIGRNHTPCHRCRYHGAVVYWGCGGVQECQSARTNGDSFRVLAARQGLRP